LKQQIVTQSVHQLQTVYRHFTIRLIKLDKFKNRFTVNKQRTVEGYFKKTDGDDAVEITALNFDSG